MVELRVVLAGEKIEESLLGWLTEENALCSSLSLLLQLFLLAQLEVGIEEAEGGDDEEHEEVDDLEGDVSLHFHVIPVSSNSPCRARSSGITTS